MIEPPAYLQPDALVVWRRITGNLERLGAWEDIFQPMAFVSATQVTMYVECCAVHGPRAPVTQECRQVARRLLVEMLYLDRVLEVREDDLGGDLDLLELCVALEDTGA